MSEQPSISESSQSDQNDGEIPDITPRTQRVVQAIAIFEAAKGTLALLIAGGAASLVHRDVKAIIDELLGQLHLDSNGRMAGVFLAAAGHADDGGLWLLVGVAIVYSIVRFAEAYGLWHDRRWAAWFAALSGAVYIPVDIYEIVERHTWPTFAALALNLGIVGLMVQLLRHRRRNATVREPQ